MEELIVESLPLLFFPLIFSRGLNCFPLGVMAALQVVSCHVGPVYLSSLSHGAGDG